MSLGSGTLNLKSVSSRIVDWLLSLEINLYAVPHMERQRAIDISKYDLSSESIRPFKSAIYCERFSSVPLKTYCMGSEAISAVLVSTIK